MTGRTEAAAAIEAVGPLLPDIEAVLAGPAGDWIVRLGDLDVGIEHDDGAKCLFLSVDLGPVPADRRREIHANLLRYNLLRRDTGGVTAALTADDAVVLMLDLREEPVTADLLRIVLDNLAAKARLWRTYMLAPDEPPPQNSDGFVTIQA